MIFYSIIYSWLIKILTAALKALFGRRNGARISMTIQNDTDRYKKTILYESKSTRCFSPPVCHISREQIEKFLYGCYPLFTRAHTVDKE